MALASAHLEAPCLHPSKPFPLKLELVHTGVASATAFAAVPSALLAGKAWGGAFSNLYVAAIPALFVAAVLPPVLVTAAVATSTHWLAPERFQWKATLGILTAVHVAALVAGSYAHVWTGNTSSLLTFAAADAALLGITAGISTYFFKQP